MPSKKGRRIAARQAQIGQLAKRRAQRVTSVPALQPNPPSESAALAAPPTPAAAEVAQQPAAAEPSAPTRPVAPSARLTRRERPSLTAQSAAGLRAELLRVGVVALLISGILIGLRFGTNLGG